MSSGARQSLSYAKEATMGVTPTPFDRKTLPFVTTSLDSAPTKEDSNTISDSRIAQQGAVTSVDNAGDIEVELRAGIYDDLLAGNAYNEWEADTPTAGSDTLKFGGDVKQSFSIVRGYDDIENYHTFRGMFVNTWALTIPESGFMTSTFGMMGLGRTPSDTVPAGVITTPTPLPPVFSSVAVEDIMIDGITTKGVACVTEFSFTWDNTSQTQRCLGGGLEAGNIISGIANGTGSITLAWSKDGAKLYEKQFKNQLSRITVKFKDGLNNEYTLDLPKVETTGNLPSAGASEIVSATYDMRVVEDMPLLIRKLATP